MAAVSAGRSASIPPATTRARWVTRPLLLARAAPTWLCRDRPAGAAAAAAAGASLVLMDDGMQNPGLAKDLCLAVVDGGAGVGNGRVLPAGPLREPLATGLGRAHALVLVGPDRQDVLAALGPLDIPVIEAALVPGDGAGTLGQRPVVAFAGIGRPGKFFETLTEVRLHGDRTLSLRRPPPL